MTVLELIFFCLTAYFIGAIPFSWLFAKGLKGIDLRTVGSGNLGSTNAIRALGLKWGLTVQVLDILKGWIPVMLPVAFLPADRAVPPPVRIEHGLLIVGICAIVGHMFPVYMRFRGGKGVNTSMGVYLALAPKALLTALAIGLLLLAVTRIVSVCSMVGSVALFAAIWFFYPDRLALIVVTGVVAALVIFMHRSNIRRLLAGTEARITDRVKPGEHDDNRRRQPS